MIRNEFKARFTTDLELERKKRSKSIKDKSKSNKKECNGNYPNTSSKSLKNVGNQKRENGRVQKLGSFKKTVMKENKPINQDTPKNYKICKQNQMTDDALHMQSIKFISKECSSIKENHNDDCISFSNSGNNLDDFSPLFDRISKQNNSKQDFTLEIYGIEDSDSYYQLSDQKDISFSQKSKSKKQNSHAKGGRIKKNIVQNTVSEQKKKKIQFQGQILEIFKTLDSCQKHILTKQNCSSEKLTTELNYLIGSILNKIKVKSKEYDYLQFETEFKSLIEDSERQEILEILDNNRKKRIKLTQPTQNNNEILYVQKNLFEEPKLSQRQILSPQFKKIQLKEGVAEKLNKINGKLNMYLAKNNLQEYAKSLPYEKGISSGLAKDSSRQNLIQKQRTFFCKASDDLRVSKSTEKQTMATENSNVSCQYGESFHRSHVMVKQNIEVIKKTDGSAFELDFTELNKHLD